ncbi:hypothetical protein BGZ63DRAFT_425390 [Mariannaea sp. PMI_226]|nr:hypothetical protein BGZ63DRAFT_425390 [Mariannaea sp. PMI_226]
MSSEDALTPPDTASQPENLLQSPRSQDSTSKFSDINQYPESEPLSAITDSPMVGDTGESSQNCYTMQDYDPTSHHCELNIPLGSIYNAPSELFDFEPDMTMELNEVDLQHLDAYNINIPFEVGPLTFPTMNDAAIRDGPLSSSQPIIVKDAFKTSQWTFHPSASDSSRAEEHNLSISTNCEHSSPVSGTRSDNERITPVKLATTGRDKILTTVMKYCNVDSVLKSLSAFPSLELLDSLIQFYLASTISQATEFIHTPILDPNQQRPELIAAMVAHGAVLTLDPTLTKFGYALQECMRVTIPILWEERNELVRELELTQSFFILLEIGLWSGQSRKVEIAESLFQPILTMLRRGNKFKRSFYQDIIVHADMGIEELDQKWRLWVQYESFRRLCLRLLRHDSNSSISLLINPLLSCAEIILPMPMSKHADFLFDDADYIDDPGLFDVMTSRNDTASICQAFLSCAWSLSWDLIQYGAMQRRSPQLWNASLLTSRRDELIKKLNSFRFNTESILSNSPGLVMQLENIYLHLHVSVSDVQIFAGIEGRQRSSEIYPLIETWAKSEAARTAVWYAGQILRATRLLPRGQLQGPLAIMLYQASLVLWVYGLWCGHCETQNPMPSEAPKPRVYLDDAETVGVRRFTQLGSGLPCLTFRSYDESTPDDGQIPLSDHETVLDIILTEFTERSTQGENRSILVNKLMHILARLRESTEGTTEQ